MRKTIMIMLFVLAPFVPVHALDIGTGPDPYGYCRLGGLDLPGLPGSCGSSSRRRSYRSGRSSFSSSSQRRERFIQNASRSSRLSEPCEKTSSPKPVVRGDYSSYIAALLAER